jgi:hypothetical protein
VCSINGGVRRAYGEVVESLVPCRDITLPATVRLWDGEVTFSKDSQRYRPGDLNGGLARCQNGLFAISHQKWSGVWGHFGARAAVRRNVRLPCPEDI